MAVAGAAFADVVAGRMEPDQARAGSAYLGRVVQMVELELRVGLNPRSRRSIPIAAPTQPIQLGEGKAE